MLRVERYAKVPVLQYPKREWPNKEIEKARPFLNVHAWQIILFMIEYRQEDNLMVIPQRLNKDLTAYSA